MLCYAMLCYAMLCYAMLCYAMLRYAMLYYARLRYARLCYAVHVPMTKYISQQEQLIDCSIPVAVTNCPPF